MNVFMALLPGLFFSVALSTNDAEVMEFEDELSDPDYVCHWSLWTELACRTDSGGKCRADLRRRCVCLKFKRLPPNVNFTNYLTRTCSFGTLQDKTDKPNGHCDSNCQLLDAFFRRLEGVHGSWCSWSDWQRSTCRVGLEGLLEGYKVSQRHCLCPPPWQEGDSCHGAESRSRNCRDNLSDVPSRFLTIWTGIFNSVIIGVILPLAFIVWFCCLAGPIRQGLQLGRLQSGAVVAELSATRPKHLVKNKKRTAKV